MPLVSILIPAYNSGPWIRDTLISAVEQTWADREIIVVDDGSTDDTRIIARKFEPCGVRVLYQPNRGASAARNTALAASTGDYIQWLDADDLLAPDKIEQQVRAIESGNVGPQTLISGAWAYFNYRQGRARFAPSPLWADLSPVDWLTLKLSHNLHMQPANWLVSRELTEAAGPWNETLSHDDDGEYFSRVLTKSSGTHFVPWAKSYYRQVGFSSLSHVAANSKKLESLFLSMSLHMRYLLLLEDSERTRQACVTYIRNWLHEFYPYRPDIVEELRFITEEMGGTFEEPKLSPKYQWLVNTLGWGAARKAQIMLPRLRHSAAIGWDRLLWQIGMP